MKLNRGLLLASALVVGSLAVTGCSKSSDEGVEPETATTEQASAADQGESQAAAPKDEGTVEYARFGHGGRGRGFGGRGRGFGHGGRVGLRHGRPWWRIW